MNQVLFIVLFISLAISDICLAFDFFRPITNFVGLTESCYSKWIPANITGLEEDFRKNVYGQPFLISALIPVLKHHFNDDNNRKALVLSFHGSPGTGKNYVVELIAKHIFKKGFDSQFFNFFSGISDFTRPDLDYNKQYISNIIEKNVKECERSMFVFDETDKMPDGVLEGIKSYIDIGRRKDRTDYRKATYIFLSNIGESLIIDKTVELWKNHLSRDQFHLKEFQDILFPASYNVKGGLRYSTTVRNALIDLYLPFLPLEKKHVKQCIIAEAKRQNHTASQEFIKNIMSELDFGPSPENIFASHGCKQIETKVVLQIALHHGDFQRFNDEL